MMLPYPPVQTRSVPVPGWVREGKGRVPAAQMKMSVAGGGRGVGVTWSQETTAQGAADQLSDVFIAATSRYL